MYEECPLGVWKVSRGCLERVWKVSEGCLEGVWKVSTRLWDRPSQDRSSQDWSSQERLLRTGELRTGQGCKYYMTWILDQIFFRTQKFLISKKNVGDKKFSETKFFQIQIYLRAKIFLEQNFFQPHNVRGSHINHDAKKISNQINFWCNATQTKMHLKMEFDSSVGPNCYPKHSHTWKCPTWHGLVAEYFACTIYRTWSFPTFSSIGKKRVGCLAPPLTQIKQSEIELGLN